MNKWVMGIVALVALGGATWLGINRFSGDNFGERYARGNGRIEAIEIDIASKMAGRVGAVLVKEGDYVKKDSALSRWTSKH